MVIETINDKNMEIGTYYVLLGREETDPKNQSIQTIYGKYVDVYVELRNRKEMETSRFTKQEFTQKQHYYVGEKQYSPFEHKVDFIYFKRIQMTKDRMEQYKEEMFEYIKSNNASNDYNL